MCVCVCAREGPITEGHSSRTAVSSTCMFISLWLMDTVRDLAGEASVSPGAPEDLFPAPTGLALANAKDPPSILSF